MGRHSTGGLYLNFPGLGEEKEELVKAGYGANYERLAVLKAKYDPPTSSALTSTSRLRAKRGSLFSA